MSKNLIKHIASYFYPQNIFARSILYELKRKDGIHVIIDAPCGNGETSFHLSKIKNAKVFAYDISETSINNAKNHFAAKNLFFESCDILNVFEKIQQCDVFCLINSFFLLPKQELILSSIHKILNKDGLLMMILPNIVAKNYVHFLKHETNKTVNNFLLGKKDFTSYFNKNGFQVKKEKGIIYTHYYGRKDTQWLSVFSHFYLTFLNSICFEN